MQHRKITIMLLAALPLIVGLNGCSKAPESAQPQTHTGKSDTDPSSQPKDFPTQVFFGDTHLHTSYSADAGMAGASLGPDEAYRFALGEAVTSNTGQPAKLSRPYDFLVVADHSENLGLAPMIASSDPLLLKNPTGKRWHDMVKAGKGNQAFGEWISNGSTTGKDPINSPEIMQSAWSSIIKAAEKYNQPGKFTAFIGYEWTSTPDGNNMHRNVIFRDGGDRAAQVLPFSSYDSQDPERLWAWMQGYEDKTGGRVLAIPHNGNLSGGMMWAAQTVSGKPYDRAYAELRARREPIIEVTQPKGTSEAHPALSPSDEFANFEIWDKSNLGGNRAVAKEALPGSYAREALKNGLAIEQKLGANPFKFGMVGSTDAHTALSTVDEDNFFGKTTTTEPSAERWNHAAIPAMKPELTTFGWALGASGLAAVWARENTRESLFEAMERREVYGTTGPRMSVRLFGGWSFADDDAQSRDLAKLGYAKGVPMGGTLSKAPAGKAPSFLLAAMKDAMGANLDRYQVVKGWLDADGKTHEKVYDVVWSDNRKLGADGRLPAVGNTVDAVNASYTNSIGAAELKAVWTDPEFDPKLRAFYYGRVLQIPTPRWTAFDAKRYGLKLPKEVPLSVIDRAYTSPIWYNPQ